MLTQTLTAITRTADALLDADRTIEADELAKIRDAIRAALTAKTSPAKPTVGRLYKRGEVAKLAGVTAVSIDRYARRGFLRRIRLGNSSRASGFDPVSVENFLAGRAADAGKGVLA